MARSCITGEELDGDYDDGACYSEPPRCDSCWGFYGASERSHAVMVRDCYGEPYTIHVHAECVADVKRNESIG